MKVLLLAVAMALANGHNKPPACINMEDNILKLSVHCSSEKEDYFASLTEELKGMVQEVIPLLKTLISPPRHCKDLLDSGDSESGLRYVYPNPDQPLHRMEVYCEQNIDAGGWTVFQRRSNSSTRQSFERTWEEYKEGFGEKTGEFWLGLESLRQLASRNQELRIDLEDYEGERRWAKYGVFHVGSQDTNYRLTIGRYSGDAGDAMTFKSNGQTFSTLDADHDAHSTENCAENLRGGWWYGVCSDSNLNSYAHVGEYTPPSVWAEGIRWSQWRGHLYSLKRTTMMVRPAF